MQVIPFENAKLPSSVASLFQVEKLGVTGIGGFPTVSIKGKVFTRVQGDEREVILRPNTDEPAGSIEVVIVKQNPNRSKVFYTGGYTEGSDAKPTCFSNDGITPDPQSAEKQANKCAVCKNNEWGSRITENGGKGKACADSQRIAIAPIGMLNDPMLLRVPAASLKTLDTYGDSLAKRGVPYQVVVTKIGFDYTVAHPSLTFKAMGFVDDASAKEIFETSQLSVVNQIVGIEQLFGDAAIPHSEDAAKGSDSEEFAPEPKAEAKAEPKPEPKAKKVVEPKPEPKVEEPQEDAPEEKTAAPVIEVASGLAGEISSLMDSLGFDDLEG